MVWSTSWHRASYTEFCAVPCMFHFHQDWWWRTKFSVHQKGTTLNPNTQNSAETPPSVFSWAWRCSWKNDRPFSSHWMTIHHERLYMHCKSSDSSFKLWTNISIVLILYNSKMHKIKIELPRPTVVVILDMTGPKQGLISLYINNFLNIPFSTW